MGYENWTGKHPLGFPEDPILDQSWHPKPNKLKLFFSHNGEWVRVPVRREDTSGPDYTEFNIARLEKYIDIEGEIKKAVCYKKDNKDMNIWFDYEELKRALVNWPLPDTPYYYNTRRWNNRIRNEFNPEKEEGQQIPKVTNKKNVMKKKKNNRQQSTSSRPPSQHRGYSSEYEEDRRQQYR